MDKTFKNFDKFGLEAFADKLTMYLQDESPFVEGSYVLSLNSEFGSGKTTFFEMWSNKLISAGDIFKVVYLNAWESDFQGDPLLAIVLNLVDIIQPAKDSEKKIKETAGKLCKLALSIGNDLVQKMTGVDIRKAGQYAESKEGISKPEPGSACFQLYQEKQKLFEELKTLLRNFIEESKYPILVIIDELDRCRPNYAIEFLETIKHFFDIKKLIFVLGVDKNQLASSAKALFGQELNFEEYYRKFAHRNVNLPVKTHPMTEHFCRELVKEYLTEEAFEKKKRFSYAKHDSYRTDNVVELCVAFSMNARQMHELFRITANAISTTTKLDPHLRENWYIGTFFMTALSIKSRILYDQIGKKEISLSEFTIFLKGLNLFNRNNSHVFWWAALLYLGAFGNQPIDKLEQEFQTLGITEKNVKDKLNTFVNSLYDGEISDSPIFLKIYKTLEEVRTFEEP